MVFMRGYNTPVPARAAAFEYRRQVGDRHGLLPPSREPIGVALWALTALGFVGGLVFFLFGDRFVGISNGTMVGAFLATLWRDNQWLKRQSDFQDMLETLGDDPVERDE